MKASAVLRSIYALFLGTAVAQLTVVRVPTIGIVLCGLTDELFQTFTIPPLPTIPIPTATELPIPTIPGIPGLPTTLPTITIPTTFPEICLPTTLPSIPTTLPAIPTTLPLTFTFPPDMAAAETAAPDTDRKRTVHGQFERKHPRQMAPIDS
ncbi:hypothetical protein BJX61DRAFT_187200 [Aspergillus egyptiacus]|nr:hypothetical protein BJX61DRAFT_187200 [Aspergillus egyptiacus]